MLERSTHSTETSFVRGRAPSGVGPSRGHTLFVDCTVDNVDVGRLQIVRTQGATPSKTCGNTLRMLDMSA